MRCLTRNSFRFEDRTESAAGGSSGFPPFKLDRPTRVTATPDHSVDPLPTDSYDQPAIYFGFDSTPAQRTLMLYARVEVETPPGPIGPRARVSSTRLAWEYATDPPRGASENAEAVWKPLVVILDQTRSLSTCGLITLVVPADIARHDKFSQSLFWIRAGFLPTACLPWIA